MTFNHLDMLSVLMHHGIKGQKWGKRNGPPYPLKPEVKKKAYADGGGGDGSEGQSKKTTGFAAEVAMATMLLAPAAMTAIVTFAEAHQKNKAIRKIERNSAKYSNDTARAEDRKTEKIDPDTGLYLKNGETTADDDMSKVNPNFKNADAFKTNCTMCTVAMEMRQRGYDVAAGKTNGPQTYRGGVLKSVHSKWFTATDENNGRYAKVKRKDFFQTMERRIILVT